MIWINKVPDDETIGAWVVIMSIRTCPTSAARHPPTSESHKLSAAIAAKQQPFLGYTTLDPIWLWRVLYWFLCHRRIFCTLSNGLPTANYSGCMCSVSQVTQLCHHWQIRSQLPLSVETAAAWSDAAALCRHHSSNRVAFGGRIVLRCLV